MIIGEHFEDGSVKVAWRQHDVYGEALAIIVSECRESAGQAALILGFFRRELGFAETAVVFDLDALLARI